MSKHTEPTAAQIARQYRVLRCPPNSILEGEWIIQVWDTFTDEWRLWACPYYSFKAKRDAVRHLADWGRA